jgi:hypothetical protein
MIDREMAEKYERQRLQLQSTQSLTLGLEQQHHVERQRSVSVPGSLAAEVPKVKASVVYSKMADGGGIVGFTAHESQPSTDRNRKDDIISEYAGVFS